MPIAKKITVSQVGLDQRYLFDAQDALFIAI
jgi:hypothetical protein